MSWIRKLFRTFRPAPLETALDDELRFHIEQRTDELIAEGIGPEEARRRAERMFGNRTALRESTRDRDVLVWLETTLQDIRYALRGMRRRPGVPAAAMLSLALGIGANTALFSLLDSLLLKTAPVERPAELVRFEDDGSESLTHRMFETLAANAHSFSALTASQRIFGQVPIEEHGEPRTAFLQVVADSYFDTLGVDAVRGRMFHRGEGQSSAGAVAVISDSYWRGHFGASDSALGAHFHFADRDFTVVGIAPPGFHGMFLDFPGEIWIPLEQMPKPTPAYWERTRALVVLARLKPGVTRHQAAAEASALLRRKIAVVAGGNSYSRLRERFLEPLTIVECVAGMVLLIACANLANLMMARAASRQGELAIRRAVGASRPRLVRQWLTESLLISFGGASLALAVAAWLSRALLAFLPPDAAPALGILSFHPDGRVLAFTSAVALFTAALFGLAPALRATRPGGLSARRWSSRALVVCQVALCTILLTGAGLFVRTLSNLRQRESGFSADRLLVASTPLVRGLTPAQRAHDDEALRAQAAALPGVRAAAYSNIGLLSGFGLEYDVETPGSVRASREPQRAFELLISPGFFATMGTPLVAGRDLTAADDAGDSEVAVVNETFARTFLPPGNPLGRHFRTNEASPPLEAEIVGVVKDTRVINLRENPQPVYYLPYRQRSRGNMTLVVRAAGDLTPLAAAIQRSARAIDPRWGLKDVAPFTEIEDRTLVVERLVADCSGAFGALALLVAAIGLFGVLALGVAGRTKEIGLRMALGASPSGVQSMVVREAAGLCALGVAIGLPCALAGARYFAAMLYGLKPENAANIAVTVLAMGLVAGAAALIPALRAARVDPMVALRCD